MKKATGSLRAAGSAAPTVQAIRLPLGGFVRVALVIASASMFAFGLWAWLQPSSFADFTAFPLEIHFLHDAGVFQIGIGATLLAALFVSDSAVLALGGFVVANTLHTANHFLDLPLGGHLSDALILGALSAMRPSWI